MAVVHGPIIGRPGSGPAEASACSRRVGSQAIALLAVITKGTEAFYGTRHGKIFIGSENFSSTSLNQNREPTLGPQWNRFGRSRAGRRPPPFQITLAPTAVAVAEDLHRRFGDSVLLTVGCLPYPPGRLPDRPLHILTRPPPGELLDPQEAEAWLDGPATVRSGQTLHHGLLVRNLAGRELTIATNGQVTVVVVDPRTGKVIGGFAEAQHPIGVNFRVAPGTTERIPLLIGTAKFTPALGYTVPAGSWGIEVPLDLLRDAEIREPRRTPVLPPTIRPVTRIGTGS